MFKALNQLFNQYDVSNSSNIFCKICGEVGHTIDYCPIIFAPLDGIQAVRWDAIPGYNQWPQDNFMIDEALEESEESMEDEDEQQMAELMSSSPKAPDKFSSQSEFDDYFDDIDFLIDEALKESKESMEDEDDIGSKDNEATWTPHEEPYLDPTGIVADDNLSSMDDQDKILFDLSDSINRSFVEDVWFRETCLQSKAIEGLYERPLDEPLKLNIFDEGPIENFCIYPIPPQARFKRYRKPLTSYLEARASGKRVRKYLVPARAKFKRYSLNELLERRKRRNLIRPRAPD